MAEELEEKKKKPSYIFGNILGNAMSKVDMRTQYEASMMSMTLIIFGLIVTMVYITVYASFVWWYKIMIVINCLAGMVFLSSNLVTTFQQYQNYMEVLEFQNDSQGGVK